jgi:hypothetical protein
VSWRISAVEDKNVYQCAEIEFMAKMFNYRLIDLRFACHTSMNIISSFSELG